MDKLGKVTTDLVKEGLPLTNKNLMSGLEAKGLKVDRDKLDYLKQAMNKNDNFVVAISESQYSAMVRDIYDKINVIEDECFDLAKKDWTQHETETSTGEGDHSTYERIRTTDNEHKPKHDFYKLALDCQVAKTKILSGDVINASVALIESNFNRLRDETKEYKMENERLREKLKSLSPPVEE
jgi:hypothetical protein